MSEGATTGDLELGQILLRTSRLSPEQLAQARSRQDERAERLSDVLVEEGMLNSDEVLHGLAEQFGLSVQQIEEAAERHLFPNIWLAIAQPARDTCHVYPRRGVAPVHTG